MTISKQKQEIINELTITMLKSQKEVRLLEEIVASLTQKSTQFQDFLAQANAAHMQAVYNKSLFEAIVKEVGNLEYSSHETDKEMAAAKSKALEAVIKCKTMCFKLIYTSDKINRMANLIVRKKALNSLISDDLVSKVTTAGKDAANAVSLSLIALKSAVITVSSIELSAGIASVTTEQIRVLHDVVITDNGENELSLQKLVHDTITKSENDSHHLHKAYHQISVQLNLKTEELNSAQSNFTSLQAGLSAANAAALAS